MTEPILPDELKRLESELRCTRIDAPGVGVEEAAWRELRSAGAGGRRSGSVILLLTAFAGAALAAVLYMNLNTTNNDAPKLPRYAADDDEEERDPAVVDMPAMPVGGRLFTSSCWVGDRYFVVWGGENAVSGNERFTDGACYDSVTNRWTVLEQAPIGGRIRPEIIALGDDAVMIWGGQACAQQKEANEEKYLTDGVIYRIPSGAMTLVEDAPVEGRMNPVIAYGRGKALVACGYWTQYGYMERPMQTGEWEYKYYTDGAVYDVGERTWTATEFPLEGRARQVGAQVEGGCVVWGGLVEVEQGLNDEYRLFTDGALFSFETLEWKKLPECPVAGLHNAYNNAAHKVFDGRLVALKGRSGAVAVFDSEQFKWLETQQLKSGAKALSGWTDNGLYGLFGDGSLHVWDVKSRAWKACAKCPVPFGDNAYVSVECCNGKLVQWGGHDATQKPYRYSNDGAIYDMRTNQWREMEQCPLPREHRMSPETAFNGRHFLVLGGRDMTPEKNQGKGSFVYFQDGSVYDNRNEQWSDPEKLGLKASSHEIVARGPLGTVVLNPRSGKGLWFSSGE